MNSQLISPLIQGLIILGALLSIIYTLGVVWRVEQKLDTAYKLFFIAILFFTISEIINLFSIQKTAWINYVFLGSRLFFVVFFLSGILEMRKMIRKIDGEESNAN